MAVAVTDEVRKRLWARSGNSAPCACATLVRDDIDGLSGALVGIEAHIIARSPGRRDTNRWTQPFEMATQT